MANSTTSFENSPMFVNSNLNTLNQTPTGEDDANGWGHNNGPPFLTPPGRPVVPLFSAYVQLLALMAKFNMLLMAVTRGGKSTRQHHTTPHHSIRAWPGLPSLFSIPMPVPVPVKILLNGRPSVAYAYHSPMYL